ncbi:hypothetical protein H312_02654 [Anncaliia algerae PRA339]|uniref:Histone chaperone RTT106/FACT complex subunit SPT16-like middle domain-containing protein n=1 Tax=Anncaliia algerae PRA339 TaxID=1288291 RepID=A0A059EYK4_9MICR|nr:hypothetical protein H312_02654 [Anncaliia algerae PRA339]
MEEVITIENVFLNGLSSTLKISSLGFALRDSNGKVTTIKKEAINKADLFFGLCNLTLRINDEITITGLEIEMEQKVKDIINHLYNVNVRVMDLDIVDPINGVLSSSKNYLIFADDKTKFEIPLNLIESVYAHKSDSAITLSNPGSSSYFINEIVFSTENEIEVNTKYNELVIFEEIQTISPKVKNNYVFFRDYIKLIGPSNVIKINFSDILFALKIHDTLSLKVSPLRIGETFYEFISMKFDDSLVDFEVDNKRYEGKVGECFINLLMNLKEDLLLIEHKKKGYRCVNKAIEGNLYLLDEGIFFLPKPIFIPLKEISLVEFSRAYFSSSTSKTIDIKIMCERTSYKFDGLNKEYFNEIEVFLGDKNIKARSEVIVEGEGDAESGKESDYENTDTDNYEDSESDEEEEEGSDVSEEISE